jgi:hypothetical protein
MKAKPTPSQDTLRDLFDYVDGKLYWKVGGTGKIKGSEAGMITEKGYRRIRVQNQLHMAHRLIWAYHYDTVPAWIDHVDEDKLNNRVENLRAATKEQNGYNISRRKNNRSGVKGMYWSTRDKKWVCELSVNKKICRVGYFDDFDLAELVISEARALYHGPYASRGTYQ